MVAALPLALTACSNVSSSVAPETPAPDTADGPVVQPAWVHAQRGDGPLQIVDARDADAYEEGHVPGALHIPLDAIQSDRHGVPEQVAPPETVADVFSRAGLQPGVPTVVYGSALDIPGTRTAWTLAYHDVSPVHVMDGGFQAWRDAGHPTESGPPDTGSDAQPFDEVDPTLRVDAEWIQARLDDPGVALVDARSHDEYAEGHIPGAHHVDWTRNLDGEGALRPDEALEALYDDLDRGATVVTYCLTGSRSAVTWVVLRHLGFEDVRLYDGSWTEWGDRK
jgi:thiosulfate/3-mercaptopyruvate sulfurtransferase